MRYAFIERRSSQGCPVRLLCKICNVSSAGYYDWLTRVESTRSHSNRVLAVKIRALFHESDSTYGAIRIRRELKKQGVKCGKNRVARIMRRAGLVSVHKKKYRPCTTNSKHSLAAAPNVLEQDFSAKAPNQKWGYDISYIPTDEGFLCVAVVLDFFSRKVVGRAGGASLHAALCCDALKMALLRRNPPQQLIHHSDRGVQYASAEYVGILRDNNFIQSMSKTGNCYDNAMVESFFHTLKVERVNPRRYKTKKEALCDIIDYIENWYNYKRSHSSLDYASPTEYENNFRLAA